ncbi:hypothetical protein E4U57_005009 [Claviceps arundinis]|uniref:Uncharacterized protein n=1 Tax=Claviceps arundinis TaxID=1623583 RepID=A0A9P7SML5_9HYPO|nr:hypothetical protein E4U57_005009 [Claviceps arundinis]KAG5960451.1 hypothetical protein E4U56_004348 [Claviceps arundinis]
MDCGCDRLSSSAKNAEKEVLDGYQDFDILDSDEEHHDPLAGPERGQEFEDDEQYCAWDAL